MLKTLLSLSRHLYFFNTLINFSRRIFKTPHLFSRDHRFNQDTLWLFKRHRRLEIASWKVVYLSWRTVLSDVFQDTFVTFKTSIFFQHAHQLFKTCFQDTSFIFKRSHMKSRRIIIFKTLSYLSIHRIKISRHKIFFQETNFIFKTSKISSRHIVIFQDASTSWKDILENRLENWLFFQDGFQDTLQDTWIIFKTVLQDT